MAATLYALPREGNEKDIRKQRKRLEIDSKTLHVNRKPISKRHYPVFIFVPFYQVKEPVGINKGKNMEHFCLANFICRSVFFTLSFSMTDGCNSMANGYLSSTIRLCKGVDKLLVVVENHCKVFS